MNDDLKWVELKAKLLFVEEKVLRNPRNICPYQNCCVFLQSVYDKVHCR